WAHHRLRPPRLSGSHSGGRAPAAPLPGELWQTDAPQDWPVQPFPLSSVRLGDSVFTRALEQHLVLYRAYPVDRMLAVYRRNAGLDTKDADPPGGWEEFGPHPEEQRWGPREYAIGQNQAGAGGLLRGHYGGHYLSGISMAYAATGEED